MADIPEKSSSGSSEEIPVFRISEKKVDDSWKEEARREREAAAKAASSARPAPAEASPAAQSAEEASRAAGKPAQKEGGAKSAASDQAAKIFMNFLAGLAQQALMQLGEIESPFSGQRELDINGARYTLELLAVIQAKTKGNLSAEESQALGEALRDLKMRYIEVANEVQRQMEAQLEKSGGKRPGPGGTIPGPGFRG